MSQPEDAFWPIFFEVYESLPRQGPGNRACAARALALCEGLPAKPDVLDLGCGVGGQTLQLAELTKGAIMAVDSHAPSIERLRAVLAQRGLLQRVHAIVGDMARVELPPQSFDLVWSEGALYNLGIAPALQRCRAWLRPGGYVAFTDAVWRTDDPPPEVRASFEQDYPAMGRVDDVLAAIAATGFGLVGHFTLPEEAWWDNFYTPMCQRIDALRATTYKDDAQAQAALDVLAREVETHRRFGHTYAYEFFVARRT